MQYLVIILFVLIYSIGAFAAWLPYPHDNPVGLPTKQACEARFKQECFKCPEKHYSSGCVDFRLQLVEVDNPSKPIIHCEEIETYQYGEQGEKLADSMELVEDCQVTGYEQKTVEKFLVDEELKTQRLQAETEKEQEREQRELAQKRIDRLKSILVDELGRNDKGEFVSDNEFRQRIKALNQGRGNAP
jgi:hypothetical protein